MKQFYNTYKLAILIGVLFSVNSLGDAIALSFVNVEWSSLSATSKFLLIVMVGKTWAGTLLAFFNKTLGRIESGKPPFETGDSNPPFPGYGPQKPLTPATTGPITPP